MKLFIALIFFLPALLLARKNFVVQNVDNCPGEDDVVARAHVEVNNSAKISNRVLISAYLEVKEKINGPIDFIYEVNRCDLKSENCEKYTNYKVQEVCKALNARKGLMVSEITNALRPEFKCPVMPGKYTMNDTSADFTKLSILSAEGFIWIVTLKVTSTQGKKRKLAMCIRAEVKVSNSKEERRGNRKT